MPQGQPIPSVATTDMPAPTADGSSVAPPGWATAAAPKTRRQRSQVTIAIAAVVVVALLVFGVVKIVESSTQSSVNGAVPASSAPASPAPVASPPGSPAPLT
jgi:hypothetical protein